LKLPIGKTKWFHGSARSGAPRMIQDTQIEAVIVPTLESSPSGRRSTVEAKIGYSDRFRPCHGPGNDGDAEARKFSVETGRVASCAAIGLNPGARYAAMMS
jgi:hypothetical protein